MPSALKRPHSLWAGGKLLGGKGREMQCVGFDPACELDPSSSEPLRKNCHFKASANSLYC